MRIPVLITGTERRQGNAAGTGKPYDMTTVTAIDMTPAPGKRCATPLEFTLAKEDEDMRDKLDGQTLQLDISKLGVYKSRLDVQARIVRANGNGSPKA